MADKTIDQLTAAAELNDDSLLVVQQQGEAKKISGALIKQFAREQADEYVQTAVDAAGTATGAADDAEESAKAAADKAAEAAAVSLYPPQVNPVTGYWQTWDGQAYVDTPIKAEGSIGPRGPQGLPGGVTTFNGRDGVVVPQAGDYTAGMVGAYTKEEADTLLANKAPAGFGYGDKLKSISAESKDESYETFCAKVDAVLDTMPDRTAKLITAYPPELYGYSRSTASLLYRSDQNYAVLSNIGSSDIGMCGWRMMKLRYPYSSSPTKWMPFEFEHPPMMPGVEYRTTERYNGKPVYVKMVDFGTLPNSTSKFVGHGITNIYTPISANGVMSGGYTIPFCGGQNNFIYCHATRSDVVCITTADYSTYTAKIIIKYTKTTD